MPPVCGIGMGISILSYNGNVYFGLITDGKCVPVPDDIISRFAGELEKLVMLTLLHDGEGMPSVESVERHLADDKPSAKKPKKKAKARVI
jgi:diacylglycerol O-acyltransferase / wax synthase